MVGIVLSPPAIRRYMCGKVKVQFWLYRQQAEDDASPYPMQIRLEQVYLFLQQVVALHLHRAQNKSSECAKIVLGGKEASRFKQQSGQGSKPQKK